MYTFISRRKEGMSTKIIEFDTLAKKDILAFFNKTTDDEGYVVEKGNPKQRILADDGEEVKLQDFAGITKGSEIFIKNDLLSLIRLSDRLQ